MGFLKRSMDGGEPDENSTLEEQYLKLFPKIGRDFVYKEDLEKALSNILSILDPTGLFGSDYSDSEARRKAREYKNLLDSGKDTTKIYKDLINLDEE